MPAAVECRRCGQARAGLEKAPLPGAWGAAVQAGTCAACWAEWREEQTRLINHERLQPHQPADRQRLYSLMGEYLRLPPP